MKLEIFKEALNRSLKEKGILARCEEAEYGAKKVTIKLTGLKGLSYPHGEIEAIEFARKMAYNNIAYPIDLVFVDFHRTEPLESETITRTSYACSDCGREYEQRRGADECCFAGCPHTWEMDKTTDWGDGMFTMNVSCRKCGAKSYIEGHADENSDSNPTPKFNAEKDPLWLDKVKHQHYKDMIAHLENQSDLSEMDRVKLQHYKDMVKNDESLDMKNAQGSNMIRYGNVLMIAIDISASTETHGLDGKSLNDHYRKIAISTIMSMKPEEVYIVPYSYDIEEGWGGDDWREAVKWLNNDKNLQPLASTLPLDNVLEHLEQMQTDISRDGMKNFTTMILTDIKPLTHGFNRKNYKAEGESEYECQVCGKPADYNFQDATIRWDIINDEFSGSPKVSEYAGQMQNDFYCQEHADEMETSDFFAEYDFQNQAITTIIADEEDEAYEIFARTYDPTTEDWEVIDVREGEGSNMNENVLTIAIDISGSTGSQMLSPQGLVEKEISLNHYYRKMAISAIMSMKPEQVHIVPYNHDLEEFNFVDWKDAVKWLKDDKNLKPMGGTLPLNKVLQELNQMQERMEKSSKPPQYLIFSTMILTDVKPLTYGFSAESLKFKEWADQEMMTHGGRESFQDWLDDEVSSHGNTSLEDWGEHEIASHEARYEAENVLSMKNLGAVAVGGALGIALVGLFTGKNLLTDMTSKLSKASEAKKDCHSCNTNGSVRKNQTQVLSSEYSVGQINPVEVEGQQDIHGAEGVNNPRFAPSPSPAPHRAKSSKWL